MPPRNRNKGQPSQAPPGLQYGQRQELQQAQDAVPIPDQRGRLQRVMQAASQMRVAGQPLNAPTARPNEPITAGLPVGPGAGPSGQMPGVPQPSGIDPNLLPALRLLPILEAQANRPGASPALRNYVRQLRSMLPPGVSPADLGEV